MQYKYPIETHNSMGYHNINDFNFDGWLEDTKVAKDFGKKQFTNLNQSSAIICSYKELKKLLGKPIKLHSEIMFPKTKKVLEKYGSLLSSFRSHNIVDSNYLGTIDGRLFLSDVMWLVALTDKKHKGRKFKDWFVIRNFGNGKNTSRFLNYHSMISSIILLHYYRGSFEDKIAWLDRNYSKYSVDSKTYGNAESISHIWLDRIIKELDAFGTFDPVNVSDNEHWLISKYKSHLSSSSAREVHEPSQLLEYYIKEMN